MVTKGNARKLFPVPCKMIPLTRPWLSVEELEERLETSRFPVIHAEPCDCLGALCHCDGQECVTVCPSYCPIHYG